VTPIEQPIRRRRRGCYSIVVGFAAIILLVGGAAVFVALRGLSLDPLPRYQDLLPALTATPSDIVSDTTEEPPLTQSPQPLRLSPRQGVPQSLSAEQFAEQVFAASNLARRSEGLPQLTFSECAADQARTRAAALIGTGTLEHAPLAPVINACDPPGLTAAENLLRGDVTPEEGVEMWLESPGHAANLLSPELSQLGVGCVRDATGDWPGWICAQIFLN